MAKKKGKASVANKIVIVGLILIAVEGIFLFTQQGSEPVTIRQAIQKALDQQALDSRTREQMRIQLALRDYMTSNQGQLPDDLNALVPKYFDVVPVDPETGKEFAYKVDGEKFFVGEPPKVMRAATGASSGSPGSGDPESMTDEEQQVLLASLNSEEMPEEVYDPTGKRDPFRPFDLAPEPEDDGTRTELEKYSIGQLRLTAVLDGLPIPKAIVETSTGRGFTVEKGTKIGTNNGEVIEILPDKILILESTIDFTGEKKTNTVEMTLRTKGQ